MATIEERANRAWNDAYDASEDGHTNYAQGYIKGENVYDYWMDKNILENAKFGDKFKTRGGKCAILRIIHYTDEILDECYLITPDDDIYVGSHGISKDGKSYRDIVSPWEEPIDEEKLNKLAYNYARTEWCGEGDTQFSCVDGFKAGYRKAMEG